MATRLPGTLKFKPKPGRSKTSGPATFTASTVGQSLPPKQAAPPTPASSGSAVASGSQNAVAPSTMPPPSGVPRRPSVSMPARSASASSVPATDMHMPPTPADSQATLFGSSSKSNSPVKATIAPEKRPGPEDAGPSTPPSASSNSQGPPAFAESQSSTLFDPLSQASDRQRSHTPISQPQSQQPAQSGSRPRAASPALSTVSVASARSTSSTARLPYSRPGGGKALLVAAAQSSTEPLDLPTRRHRGSSRASSRAPSATPSRMSEAPPDREGSAQPSPRKEIIRNGSHGGDALGTSPTKAAPVLGSSSTGTGGGTQHRSSITTDGPPSFASGQPPAFALSRVDAPPSFSTEPRNSTQADANAPLAFAGADEMLSSGTHGDDTTAAGNEPDAGEKRKRPAGKKSAAQNGENNESPAKAAGAPRKKQRRKKETWANRDRVRLEEVEDDADDEDHDELGAEEGEGRVDGRGSSATPAPSTASGRRKGRVAKRTKRKTSPRISIARANLELAEPGEMIGEEIDESSMTMAELATSRAAEGKVSTRGKKLDQIIREREREKLDARGPNSDELFRTRQPLRRKYRAQKNAERAERRAQVEGNGGDPAEEVSDDEADTEIDYDHEPERLTPETTPEPGFDDYRPPDDAAEGAAAELEYDEDGNPIYPEDEEEQYDENGELIHPVADVLEGQEDLAPEDEEMPEEGDADKEDGDGGGKGADEDPDDEYGFANYTFTRDHSRSRRAAIGDGGDGDEDEEDDDGADIDIGHQDDDPRHHLDSVAAFRAQVLEYEADDVVEEDQEGVMVNNATHAKRKPRDRWTAEETEMFYSVLSETGENYGLMAHYFPGRTIDQVKRKALRENRVDPQRVTDAILNRKRLDPKYLSITVGYDPDRNPDGPQALFAEAEEDSQRIKKSASEMADARAAEEAQMHADVDMEAEGEELQDGYDEHGQEEGYGDDADNNGFGPHAQAVTA